MSASTPASKTSSYRWHSKHNDPDDNVIFVSADNVCFRASKQGLDQNSTQDSSFAADMPPLDNTTFQDPIALDAHSKVVDLFLTLIKSPKRLPKTIDEDSLLDLYRLCDIWGCSPAIVQRVRAAFEGAEIDPWRVLIYANTIGGIGDVLLARIAIAKFLPNTRDHFQDFDGKKGVFMLDFWTRLAQLQPAWQLSLIHAVFGVKHLSRDDVRTRKLRPRDDWVKHAADFNPDNVKNHELGGSLIYKLKLAIAGPGKSLNQSRTPNQLAPRCLGSSFDGLQISSKRFTEAVIIGCQIITAVGLIGVIAYVCYLTIHGLLNLISRLGEWVARVVSGAWSSTTGTIVKGCLGVVHGFEAGWNAIVHALNAIGGWILGGWRGLGHGLSTIFGWITGGFSGLIHLPAMIWKWIARVAKSIVGGITGHAG